MMENNKTENTNEKNETIIHENTNRDMVPHESKLNEENILIDPMTFDEPDEAKMKKDVWDLIYLLCPELSNMLIDIFRNGGGADGVTSVYNDIIRYATIVALVNNEIPVGTEIKESDT